jgi:hypothetical protein
MHVTFSKPTTEVLCYRQLLSPPLQHQKFDTHKAGYLLSLKVWYGENLSLWLSVGHDKQTLCLACQTGKCLSQSSVESEENYTPDGGARVPSEA